MLRWWLLFLLVGCRPGNIWVVDGTGPTDAGSTEPVVRLDGGVDAPNDAGPTGTPRDTGSTTPPPSGITVSLVRPTQGEVLESEVAFAVSVTGPVVRVDYLADDQVVASAASAPFEGTATLEPGNHTIVAEAFDADGASVRSAAITIAVESRWIETFSGGAPDQPGWTLGAFAIENETLRGEIRTTELQTFTERAEVSVELGTEPKLMFRRKVDLGGAGFVYTSAVRTLVNGTVVDEVTTNSVPLTEDWATVDLDLAAYADQQVTLGFEITVTNWSWNQEAHATVWIDDVALESSGGPPPPPPPPPPSGSGYEHATEAASDLSTALSITGRYGVSFAGGHLVAGDASGSSTLPRETPVSSSATLEIPAGATVTHAALWYAGVVFLKPHDRGEGDYTADVGGPLDNPSQVAGNGITFSIDGQSFGPFDPAARPAPNPSALGSESTISPRLYDPSFGTLTGVKESVWGNRVDVTGLLTGRTGTLSINVDPPERLDVSGNSATSNGGNPAGNTTHNLCTSGGSWTLMVIYEKSDLPEKNIVLMDGPWARAWDYMFFHKGEWIRPKVRIDHAPIQPGARLVIYAGSGAPSGGGIPTSPACSCGCGGQYTLKSTTSPLGRNTYFSDQHDDPAPTLNDPMHRDRSNGPWYLHSTGRQPIAGNDWTLFESGGRFTEFPNLFEGEHAPSADGIQPSTDEDNPDSSADTYGGHPWAGRGSVSYLAHGNAMSVVEVVPEPSRLSTGETTSYVYFKGDQKDVWKPQAVVSVKFVLLETPTGNP